jgi:hypothetical protein
MFDSDPYEQTVSSYAGSDGYVTGRVESNCLRVV